MPLDVVSEHAQKNMGAHAIFEPVVDWADLQIARFNPDYSCSSQQEKQLAGGSP